MASSGDGVAEIHGFSLGAKFVGLIAGIILQRHRSTPVALGNRVVDLGHGGPAGRPGGGRPIQGLQQTLLGVFGTLQWYTATRFAPQRGADPLLHVSLFAKGA